MTPYSDLYEKTVIKINDPDIKLMAKKQPETLAQWCKEWFLSAISRMQMDSLNIKADLSNRDDEQEIFKEDLEEYEKEVISFYMVVEWYSPQVDSLQHTSLFIGTKEAKFNNQGNHMASLRQRQKELRSEARRMVERYKYHNGEYTS